MKLKINKQTNSLPTFSIYSQHHHHHQHECKMKYRISGYKNNINKLCHRHHHHHHHHPTIINAVCYPYYKWSKIERLNRKHAKKWKKVQKRSSKRKLHSQSCQSCMSRRSELLNYSIKIVSWNFLFYRVKKEKNL